MIELGIISEVLVDEQNGFSTDGSGVLLQVVLSLRLGQTHVQEVNQDVDIIQGHYPLCSLVSLWAAVKS